MTTATLEKPASELTTEELAALLAEKQQAQSDKKQKARQAYETLRDEDIKDLVIIATRLNDALGNFKLNAYERIDTLYKMLQEHSSRHANGKGSVTLETSDNQYRVVFKRQDHTRFDERATQAEAHILDFLTSEFPDGSSTSKLVRSLLERKKGTLDKNLVLKLISMKDDFANENWRKGIELLQESIVPDSTKFYAQFFYRTTNDDWEPIVLDFAKL